MKDPSRELPEDARAILKKAVQKLEHELEQSRELKRTTQTETGVKYYEGLIRGLETCIIVLQGEAENARREYDPGNDTLNPTQPSQDGQ